MKKNYNPRHLNKRQRHLKKWIPVSIYCDNCPFWHDLTNKVKHRRELCEYSNQCMDNCSNCEELISYCSFLNYIEYGIYPLGEGCKVCGLKEDEAMRKDIKEYTVDLKLNRCLENK